MARTKLSLLLPLIAIAACNAPAPPAAPTVTVTAPPPEPPPSAAPPAPEPPPFVPKPPFAIVAQAAGDEDFAVFPIEGGAAIIASGKRGDVLRTLRLSVIERDQIRPAPELAMGLPSAVLGGEPLPILAGRFPDALWLAHGGKKCAVYEWQPAQKMWEARAARGTPSGRCTHLAAWTPGAAIAATEGPSGPDLTVFGAAPRRVPAMPPRRPDQPRECAQLAGNVHGLFAFTTGEVIAAGAACGIQHAWIARWPSGAAKGDVVDAEVDPGVPYLARALSKDAVVVHGAGVIGNGEITSVEVRFEVVSGRFRRTSIQPHEVNALELWMYQGPALFGLTDAEPKDGFRYEGYVLTPTDDVFVFGKLVRRGHPVASLLLRNRTLKASSQ